MRASDLAALPLPFVAEDAESDAPAGPRLVAVCPGMPGLDPEAPRMPAFKRRIPEKLFYVVPAFMWLALGLRHRCLTLPSAANSPMEAGGLWGESKAQGLALFGPEARRWVAPWIAIVRGREAGSAGRALRAALRRMEAAGFGFPIVAKPDRGYQGWGVRRIEDAAGLAAYLAAFPPRRRLLLQRASPWAGEAGLLYVRRPGAGRGEIYSLALAYPPHLFGDGVSPLRRLILADPLIARNAKLYLERHAGRLDWVPAAREPVILAACGSARMGAVFVDARHLATEALLQRFERIAADIPGFAFGRFDVRFASLEQFLAGEAFEIVELNGTGAEVLHIWDARARLMEAYRALWDQYRLAFAVGACSVAAGRRPAGFAAMLRRQRLQDRLRRLYPNAG